MDKKLENILNLVSVANNEPTLNEIQLLAARRSSKKIVDGVIQYPWLNARQRRDLSHTLNKLKNQEGDKHET